MPGFFLFCIPMMAVVAILMIPMILLFKLLERIGRKLSKWQTVCGEVEVEE